MENGKMVGLKELIVLYMVKSVKFCLVLVLLISCTSKAQKNTSINQETNQVVEKLEKEKLDCNAIIGNWHYQDNNDKQDFGLTFQKINNIIYGKHCLIYGLQGDLIDCDPESKGSVFECFENDYRGELISYYFPDSKSKVSLIIKSKDTIVFKVIPETESFSYFRSGMIFIRD
ncbi:hypothetical protein ACJRPK_16425 [Aquimarina sp. 2-A2]|uniref:hypothetical protein n=1 Tax=Aquimarina sp. 2-A2 TaxID=3382644 RepID=UPI00387F2179